MGRPPTRTAELVSVSVNGRGAAWCDGIFSGDRDITFAAEASVLLQTEVPVGRLGMVEATDSDPLGATAALFAYSPGRTIVVEAPDQVRDVFEEALTHDDATTWEL